MQTSIEMLEFIRQNPELLGLIENSKFISGKYIPRSAKRSQTSLALKHFWSSREGAHFRFAFEKASGASVASSRACGLLKTAIFTIIIEHRLAKGMDT